MKKLACAIYTRKSSEEGLDQSFNSLDAQREACQAYVLSQAGEGWTALPTRYDDGGFSGGSMERPGLKRLLADIAAGAVDVVVVYKVDRLTRSLADFAKIVEILDARGASFVSVTQAFNTTTSMGRLTLNVLLSFAQFEREVTGERIRDKIAASKAKGMWMGGRPPLGYDAIDQKLVVNPSEAEQVRSIFTRYLELGSVGKLVRALATEDMRAKSWTTRDGRPIVGATFTRGALGYLLRNDVYRGAIRHGKLRHWNAHAAIIDEDLWAKVQSRLDEGSPAAAPPTKRAGSALLKGKIFDDAGGAMQPIHANRRGRRYHYYVSSAKVHGEAKPVGSLPRIGAPTIEGLIIAEVGPRIAPSWRPNDAPHLRIAAALKRVTLSAQMVTFELHPEACAATGPEATRIVLPIQLKHRQGVTIIAAAGQAAQASPRLDKTLVRAVALARDWRKQLEAGESTTTRDLAKRFGLCPRHTARVLMLGYLAPDLVDMILEGRQPQALCLQALTARSLPRLWSDQRRLFASFA
ncbi:MAG: recombinase family protein [Caulobacteraceae bacterium]